MNGRDPQMLAHEMAIYQRARAPGGNNSPRFQHPPGVQVQHSNIHPPQPVWTGGRLAGHVPHAMGVQQHPSHGHGNGPNGLPRQPQLHCLQQQRQQQQQQLWGMNVPPQGPPHSRQAHMQQPRSWLQAQQPQPQERGQQVQHQMGYNNLPLPPQQPPQQHSGYNNSPLPPPPYHHQHPQQQHNPHQAQQQHLQQWQSGGPPPNSLNGAPRGSSGSMLRPPLQNGLANAGGWVQNTPQQNNNNNNKIGSNGNNGGYSSAIKPHQKRAASVGGRGVRKAMDSTTNDLDNTSNKADRHRGESCSPEANGAATSDGSVTVAVAAAGEGAASAVTAVSLFCEPCEKDFASVSARQAHLLSHVPCSEVGCNFSASRKVVGAHHSATHGRFSGSGFQTISVEGRKFRVLLGTSPEEVEEWRAARRKRWPTIANMAKKEEEEKKRRALGGLAPDPGPMARGGRGSRGRGGRGGGGRGRGTPGVQSGGNSNAAVPKPKVVVEMDDGVAGARRGAKRGGEEAGLSAEETTSKAPRIAVVDDMGPSAADKAEVIGNTVPEQTVAAVAGQRGVGGEENAGEGRVATEDSANVATGARKRPCTYFLRAKCLKGEGCTFSHDIQRQNCSYFMSGKCHRGKGCTYIHDKEARAKVNLAGAEGGGSSARTGTKDKITNAARNAKPEASKPTLLRKLLAPQLRRESSIALQAVRFVVASDFFLAP